MDWFGRYVLLLSLVGQLCIAYWVAENVGGPTYQHLKKKYWS